MPRFMDHVKGAESTLKRASGFDIEQTHQTRNRHIFICGVRFPMSSETAPPLLRPPWLTSWRDCRQSGLDAFFQNGPWGDDPWGDTASPSPRRGYWNPNCKSLFQRNRYVSVWVGNFPNAETLSWFLGDIELDSYGTEDPEEMVSPLWDEMGFYVGFDELYSRFFRERVPVAALFNDLPHSLNFCREMLANCENLGVEWGNTILAIYNLDHWGLRTLMAGGYLRFVGSARYC